MAISYSGGQKAGRTNASAAVEVTFGLTGGSDSVPRGGDLVVVTVVAASAGTPAMAITTPSGYTALTQLNQGATNNTSINVSRKRMGATPDTTVTIPGTGNNAWGEAYAIQVFRGVDDISPLDVAHATAQNLDSTRCNPNSITPVTPGAWVLICGGGAAATGSDYTAPANYTTNFLTVVGTDTYDAQIGCGYRAWTSGAEDPAAYTGGSVLEGDTWAVFTIALRPFGMRPGRLIQSQAVKRSSHW